MKHLRLHRKQNITSISFKEEWKNTPVVIYPNGLGKVRDLVGLLPEIKNLNVKFFLDGSKEENYEAVQILSSLGVYSGIVMDEKTDWERLTDLMYYALCGKVPHAPIEPFQFVYEMYNRNRLVDYGRVYFEETNGLSDADELYLTTKNTMEPQSAQRLKTSVGGWQRFFYESTECAACEGWRICMGKYAEMTDKTGCQKFMTEWLNTIEELKFKTPNP